MQNNNTAIAMTNVQILISNAIICCLAKCMKSLNMLNYY